MLDENNISIEEQDTSNEPELDLELDDEIQDPDETKAEVSEDVEVLKAKLAELEHKNKQLYARLKKEPEKVVKKPSNNSQPEGDSDWKQKIEFITTKGRSLDAEDVDEVIAYAKGKGISYEEALNSPVIKAHLKVKQHREKIANATPRTSSGSNIVNGKTWSDMNEQERAKNFDKMMKRRA
ncbi:MAG: hypothetical protein EOM67_10420 [Spirochaetia bacterium]|nr:hypothetical protein [Spirochaetia bacterium]